MVCLGNICRSPLAHGLLQQKINENNLNWEVDSAGTSSYHKGQLPDERSIEVAQKHNLDITSQRSRPFVKEDLDEFDLIYAMDISNYNNILALATTDEQRKKVRLILNEIYPYENREVPDPYWSGKDGFEKVYQMLNAATDKIIKPA